MGNSNFLKVHINGYKEGSIQYSFTASTSSSPSATHIISETSLIGSSVEKLRLPVTLGFKNTNAEITRTLSLALQNLSAGTSYAGTRSLVLNFTGSLASSTQVTCTLNYAGY